MTAQLWICKNHHANLHTRTKGSLAQIFTTDGANQPNNVTRTGPFTMSGAIPAPLALLPGNAELVAKAETATQALMSSQ
jgi:hypothetical protein